MSQPRWKHPSWKPDEDDPQSVDDLFAVGEIHLERMDNGFYWIGIFVDGTQYHIDLHSKRKITAFARELPPSKVPPIEVRTPKKADRRAGTDRRGTKRRTDDKRRSALAARRTK